MVYSNGSLLLQNVTWNDIGFYTLQTLTTDLKAEVVHVTLEIDTSISTCCNSLISAPVMINQVPQTPSIGKTIKFIVRNAPDLQAYSWYKSENRTEIFKIAEYKEPRIPPAGVLHKPEEKSSSICTCWHPSVTNSVTVEPVPLYVLDGENVLLLTTNLLDDIIALVWHKGVENLDHGIALYSLQYNVSVTGPAHSGRETIYRNGSLLIQNVTLNDKGFYTLRTINSSGFIVSTSHLYLLVLESIWRCEHRSTSAKLTVESIPQSVAEGASVTLLVHNLPPNLLVFFWYKGVLLFEDDEVARYIPVRKISVQGPAHSGREKVYSNGSLLLQNITWNDTGFYTLKTLTTDLKAEVVHVQLEVDTSFSTSCNPLSSARVMIKQVPRTPVIGETIMFIVQNAPDLQAYSWYKSGNRAEIFKIADYSKTTNSISWGPAQSTRERLFNDGSMLLQDITEKDAGFYTLQTLSRDLKIEVTHVQLHVYTPVTTPFVRVTHTVVTVHGSVVFTCFTPDTGISIRWIFNNQTLQLKERMTLSPTKCSLTIDTVSLNDAGEYQCETSNPVSTKTSHGIRLDVIGY
ncbi:pregnancy-specific glycoprotein 22-like [Acomys russatus]|uniref:pregnancy-specific glycoprotein 22-like n=1 Tax=Acomys russatus TaxID=60746 RepID=UPI0021E254D5|nr:pregnancy-specific glycoprotein 22-like [Acomys russatus]